MDTLAADMQAVMYACQDTSSWPRTSGFALLHGEAAIATECRHSRAVHTERARQVVDHHGLDSFEMDTYIAKTDLQNHHCQPKDFRIVTLQRHTPK
jgi:hypothetical protein